MDQDTYRKSQLWKLFPKLVIPQKLNTKTKFKECFFKICLQYWDTAHPIEHALEDVPGHWVESQIQTVALCIAEPLWMTKWCCSIPQLSDSPSLK